MGAEGAINPKSIYEILANTPKMGVSLVSEKEIPMLKAYSKKYKSRNILVNNTSFSFDSDGFCETPDVGNARLDFELLIKKNHVDEVLDIPEVSEEDGREEDTREGIDEVLLAASESADAAEEYAEEYAEELEEAAEEFEEDLDEETLDEEDEEQEDDDSKVDSED